MWESSMLRQDKVQRENAGSLPWEVSERREGLWREISEK